MKRLLERSFEIAFLSTVLTISMVSSAWAAPLAPARDRSDNGIFFEYNADTHEMPSSGSATYPITADDRVDFMLAVALAPEGSESPLTAVVSLRLKRAKAVRYRGTITVRIRDLFTDEHVADVPIPVDLVLRPEAGKRRATLAAPFSLPSGSYEARAIYRSAASS